MKAIEYRGGFAFSDKLSMFIQPQFNIVTGQVTDIELLARYRGKNSTIVSPAKFLPYIRQSKDRQDFTHWVIDQAIIFSMHFAKLGFVGKVAVNLDGNDLTDTTVGYLENKLRIYPQVQNLQIELTEYVREKPISGVLDVLFDLKKLGISIALDDFGVGSNGIQTLISCPFDKLKSDKSVLKADTQTSRVVIQTTLQMMNVLSKEFVIEGVETREEVELLKSWGVTAVQGFYYSRPMEKTNFIDILKHKKREKPNG